MDEVAKALEKYRGLVPLVYDIETMSLDEARPEDMQTAVYLKREADKVIAELEKEIDQLKDKVTELLLRDRSMAINFNNAVDALGHSKYKRCMAMAKWYKDKVDAIKNGYMISGIADRYGVMTTCPPECNPKFSFYEKWHKRWLELAKHYKEMAK